MSIIKGKTNIVAGFGGTKRCIGEVYFSQSSLASDNPGALPGWTGEYYENGKTLFPDLYNFVKAHSELQVTKAQYDSAITSYGECPKYVVDENGETTTETDVKMFTKEATNVGTYLFKNDPPAVGDDYWFTNLYPSEIPDTIALQNPTGKITAVSFNSAGNVDAVTFGSDTTADWEGINQATADITTGSDTVTSLRLPKRQTAGRYLVKKEVNGNNWYALYSDGWLEQGGYFGNPSTVGTTAITETFWKSYATPPTVLFGNMSHRNVSAYDSEHYPYDVTANGFTHENVQPEGQGTRWYAFGYAANTPMENIMYPWISAYTSAVPASTAQAAEFTGALSGKANTDLSNVLSNIDYVVESQVNSDGSWYRKYKSGWLEQGNSSPTGDQNFTLNKTITFPKPFADNTYTLVGPGFFISSAGAQTITRTTTGFTTSSVVNETGCVYWYACGQGAN